ncbi:MAG: DUF4389 domain-containing protein [Gammaproteobacteria bacterium]|nr:DUF4389 domain-containing protein [Gammaproteobacteria bacterium]
MSSEIKQHLKAHDTWMRGLYIVIFTIIYSIAEVVLAAVLFFQFLTTLFTGNKNERLLEFGNNLSNFIYQILKYLTYNSDIKPFPFDEWPGSSKKEYEEQEKEHGKIIGHT